MCQVNSYTLETLAGLPLAGVYNARRLWQFLPREGTRLAMDELAQMEEVDKNELQDMEEEEEEEEEEMESWAKQSFGSWWGHLW